MKVNLIAVGKVKEDFLRKGIEEYSKRLSRFCEFKVIEVAEVNFNSQPSKSEIEIILNKESENIKKAMKGEIVLSDIGGEMLSSEQLSEYITQCKTSGISEISFIIGGSYGVSDEIRKKASKRISFGKATFPHQLFRLMLTEQIYRAFMIESNSTYHK